MVLTGSRLQLKLLDFYDGIGFAANPIIAALTDTFGRRGMLLLAQVFSVARSLTMVASPNLPMVIVGDLTRTLTMSTWFIGAQAGVCIVKSTRKCAVLHTIISVKYFHDSVDGLWTMVGMHTQH